MATTLNLPYKRFVRQVSNGASLSKYGYIAAQEDNAEALKTAPWRAASTVRPQLTVNQLTRTDGEFDKDSGAIIKEPSYTAFFDDGYDAFKQAGDANSRNATMCGYAGCVAYRFALPKNMRTTCSITQMRLGLQRDRYLRSGVRVAVVCSNDEKPSSDWAVIRGENDGALRSESTVAVDVLGVGSYGFLGQPSAANLLSGRAAGDVLSFDGMRDDGSWHWVFSHVSEYKYLYVYLTLEDYTDYWAMYSASEKRYYYIEGSAMLVPAACEWEFSQDNLVANTDERVYELTRHGRTPTRLPLDPKHSAVFTVGAFYNGDILEAPNPNKLYELVAGLGGIVNAVQATPLNYVAILGKGFRGTFTDMPGVLFVERGTLQPLYLTGVVGTDADHRDALDNDDDFAGWGRLAMMYAGSPGGDAGDVWLIQATEHNGSRLSNPSFTATAAARSNAVNVQAGTITDGGMGLVAWSDALPELLGVRGVVQVTSTEAVIETSLGELFVLTTGAAGYVSCVAVDTAEVPSFGRVLAAAWQNASDIRVFVPSVSAAGIEAGDSFVLRRRSDQTWFCFAVGAIFGERGLVNASWCGVDTVAAIPIGAANTLITYDARSQIKSERYAGERVLESGIFLGGELYLVEAGFGRAMVNNPAINQVPEWSAAAGLRCALAYWEAGLAQNVGSFTDEMRLGFSANLSVDYGTPGRPLSVRAVQFVASAVVVPVSVPEAYKPTSLRVSFGVDFSFAKLRISAYIVRGKMLAAIPDEMKWAAFWRGEASAGFELLGSHTLYRTSLDLVGYEDVTLEYKMSPELTGGVATIVLVPWVDFDYAYLVGSDDDLQGNGGFRVPEVGDHAQDGGSSLDTTGLEGMVYNPTTGAVRIANAAVGRVSMEFVGAE